jgi:AcrR family transcriptional regulator
MVRKPRTEARRRPTTGGARETVRALLLATERLLRSEGPSRPTTNQIAELAGASIGSLYQYFASKDALIAALVDRRVAEQMDLIRAHLSETREQTLEQVLAAFVLEFVKLYALRPEVDSILLSLIARVERRGAMLAAERSAVAILREHLHGRGTGFAPQDLDLAAFVLVHALQAVVAAAAAHYPERLLEAEYQRQLAGELTALAMRYLRPGDRPPDVSK